MRKHRRNLSLLILVLGQMTNCDAQDSNWLTGFWPGHPYHPCVIMNVDDSVPVFRNITLPMGCSRTGSYAFNASNNLLFYTNGIYIANALNDTIPNGSFQSYFPYPQLPGDGGINLFQGTLMLPEKKANPRIYDLFTMYNYPSFQGFHAGVYRTRIDMQLNNGLGGIVSKCDTVIFDSLAQGMMTACRHANGRDWWISVPQSSTNRYYKALLTPDTIITSYQDIGDTSERREGWGCWAVYSPDGTTYARGDWLNGLMVMDFDRCTGEFSNYRHLPITQFSDTTDTLVYKVQGVAFSMNSRYLYVAGGYFIYQFDMTAPNLLNSKTIVATYDGYRDTVGNTRNLFAIPVLARNGKIYINSAYGIPVFQTIHEPDQPGVNCRVEQHSFYISTPVSTSMPNFPWFGLGAELGTVCDSLENTTGLEVVPEEQSISVYPNPVINYVQVSSISGYVKGVRFFDSQGREIYLTGIYRSQKWNFNTENLSSGIYYLQINIKDQVYFKKMIKD